MSNITLEQALEAINQVDLREIENFIQANPDAGFKLEGRWLSFASNTVEIKPFEIISKQTEINGETHVEKVIQGQFQFYTKVNHLVCDAYPEPEEIVRTRTATVLTETILKGADGQNPQETLKRIGDHIANWLRTSIIPEIHFKAENIPNLGIFNANEENCDELNKKLTELFGTQLFQEFSVKLELAGKHLLIIVYNNDEVQVADSFGRFDRNRIFNLLEENDEESFISLIRELNDELPALEWEAIIERSKNDVFKRFNFENIPEAKAYVEDAIKDDIEIALSGDDYVIHCRQRDAFKEVFRKIPYEERFIVKKGKTNDGFISLAKNYEGLLNDLIQGTLEKRTAEESMKLTPEIVNQVRSKLSSLIKLSEDEERNESLVRDLFWGSILEDHVRIYTEMFDRAILFGVTVDEPVADKDPAYRLTTYINQKRRAIEFIGEHLSEIEDSGEEPLSSVEEVADAIVDRIKRFVLPTLEGVDLKVFTRKPYAVSFASSKLIFDVELDVNKVSVSVFLPGGVRNRFTCEFSASYPEFFEEGSLGDLVFTQFIKDGQEDKWVDLLNSSFDLLPKEEVDEEEEESADLRPATEEELAEIANSNEEA